MGLDMMLYAKRYLSSYDAAEAAIADSIAALLPEAAIGPVKEVSIEVGYWRKANAIHKWFVDNIQNGVDNCGSYYVSRESLLDLKDKCEQVLKWNGLADETLPTASGFFFGCTEYDSYYRSQLEYTVEMIDKALQLPSNWTFEYTSSW